MERSRKMRNKEIVIIAMVAAVLGVLFMFLDTIYGTISTILGPVLTNLTFGIYALTALLPMVIVRKPGAGLLGSLIGAVANLLAGSPYGINILVAGLLQGLGCEVGFYLGRYKLNVVSLILSGIFITLFVTTRDYFIFGLSALPTLILVLTIIVRLFSASFIGGYISKAIEKGLQKTGVLQK